MTEGSSAARVLYSDVDSARMRRKRAGDLAVSRGATVVILGSFSVVMLASLLRSLGDLVGVAIVVGVGASGLAVGAWGFYYILIRPAMIDLRNGVFVTEQSLQYAEFAIPLASIRQAEIMRFSGWHDCLAIEYVPTTGRRSLATARIATEDTDDLERLRDVLRTAVGLPPQTRVRVTTWSEWRESVRKRQQEARP